MPSAIEWTDETWNPVTGCTRVSPGCDNCYMYAMYPRLKAMSVTGYDTVPSEVQLLPERLYLPLSWKKQRRVFVNSMSDLFHSRVPFEFVFEMFEVMQQAAEQKGHIFQILTKRPGRAVAWWKQYEVADNSLMAGIQISGLEAQSKTRSTLRALRFWRRSARPYSICFC